MLRSSVKDSVYRIIQSNIQKKWHLNLLARELCYSPSLLKKKLKYEDITYTQIIADFSSQLDIYLLASFCIFSRNTCCHNTSWKW
ncbi:AraC family transcriptional regulator [Salmonella enterica]|nr:AraC family transcriptional regulator [Salmonella enterica]EBU4459540.1 AraC family transcriptional regulator [Salmonella enterica]ECX7228047.1 AraC family transcriptional regulator [Salmonella enterica]ECX8703908.1 AraC family transcriptional regulator [Salmonella enterica]EGB2188578.1 AraC family transcriptional regulator [Salmonella enterica]